MVASRATLTSDLRSLAARYRLGGLLLELDGIAAAVGDDYPVEAWSAGMAVRDLIERLDHGDPAWRAVVWAEVPR